jgi:hypothetical protein
VVRRSGILPALALCALTPGARAQDGTRPQVAREGERPDVARGLRWLADKQAQDGSWGQKNNLALTGMCGLSLLASGSTPRRGPYAEAVSRAVEFVLSCQPQQAFVHKSSGYSAVHNHGYAMVFLTQCLGEAGPLEPKIDAALRKGINATVRAQFPNGGFGYFLQPGKIPDRHTDMWRDDEASTTISQIQALRGARDAGFFVGMGALEMAGKYIADSQHGPTGGFVYSIGSKPPRISFEEGSDVPTFAITAASSAVLHALGTYEGPVVERGVRYIEGFMPPTRSRVPFFFYGHYYAAQVMHLVGGPRGDRWMRAVLKELATRQQADGGWASDPQDSLSQDDSRILNTAWALQVAQIDGSLLPLHER